jgi:ATP-dependent RNA helicase RhlE
MHHRAEIATWLNGVKEHSLNFEQFSLDPHITAAVRAAGFVVPTPIQRQAIPVVLQGRDVMGLAQTGTGKTAAFVLPILQRLTSGPSRQVRALILAPTRELAEQIHQAISDLGRNGRVQSVSIYGGVSKHQQVAALRRGVEIVVACPGRLLDLRRILSHLPPQRQTLFFSATMPADIRSLANSILKNPVPMQIGAMAPVETVSHSLFPVSDALKPKLLLAMLQQTPAARVLIFTRTKRRARNLAISLEKNGYRVSALQGNMTQNRRQAAINGFRGGKYDILVATDIAARGIDVSQISHVINFDMPDTADAYTHRIGRTGRAHQTGEAFTFTVRSDEAIVREIEKVLGGRIERRRLPGFEDGDHDQAGLPPKRSLSQQQRPGSQPDRRRFRPGVPGKRRQARPAGISEGTRGAPYGN